MVSLIVTSRAMEHPLRRLRRDRGLTLDEAARQIGMSKGNLSRVETGRHGLSDPLKRRIAEWSDGTITANDLINYVPTADPVDAAARAAIEGEAA